MERESVDLRPLFKAFGYVGPRALESAPIERTKSDEPVDLLDAEPSAVVAAPIDVTAFCDGIQASLCLTHVAHRPIYLSYAGAAGVGPGAVPVGLSERLFIQLSERDVALITGLGVEIPLDVMASDDPPILERDAQRALGATRDNLERRLVSDLLAANPTAPLVLDGSLIGRERDVRLVGVVKTSAHQWLSDESVLYGLPEAWRSPRFIITGSAGPRYSCYVQMTDKSAGAWNHGLIRLETLDPDLLDPLAARCLAERQGSRSGDRRWDRHLASVRVTEEFLRARRPSVFSLS